jgi:collagen type III alpha
VRFVNIKVPVCVCEQKADGTWQPKRTTTTVKAITNKAGTSNNSQTIISEHEELFKANSELCLAKNKEFEAYLSVPDHWPTRSGQKPQLAIQYAENLGNGKIGRTRWTLLIPHYRYGQSHNPKFPTYEKGHFLGVQVLNDNSKITVWCKSAPECLRVINALKQYVEPKYLKGIEPPTVTDSNSTKKEASVISVLCQFFPNGQKDNAPSWSKRLRKK